ncbi:MAG: glutamate ligase domain-containing protein, partial [Gammaproteobacteria bacterium]
RVEVRLQLLGEHNVRNALAASAAAPAAGAPARNIADAFAQVAPVPGRLQIRSAPSGATLIDDTYNANPASFEAALEVLGGFEGEVWLALGDMAELGDRSVEFHEQAGRAAREAGVTRLYATGSLSAHVVRVFGEGATHFQSREALGEALSGAMEASAKGEALTVLLKGSRSAGMEKVVQALVARERTADEQTPHKVES